MMTSKLLIKVERLSSIIQDHLLEKNLVDAKISRVIEVIRKNRLYASDKGVRQLLRKLENKNKLYLIPQVSYRWEINEYSKKNKKHRKWYLNYV